MTEQFCLKWTDFQSNIVNALESLKCSEDLVDVTLTCEGQNIKAHKVILSACSPYFRGVFKENPCHHPIIILKDVLAQDIVRLLAYMYQGEVQVEEAELPSFLETAELLQIKGLTQTTPIAEQVKKHLYRTTASSSLLHQKKNITQLMISSKMSTCCSTVQKDNSLSPKKDLHKKRRNSISEKFADSQVIESPKKPKIVKDKSISPSKKSDSVQIINESSKTDVSKHPTNSETNKNSSTSASGANQPKTDEERITKSPLVQVKHEINDDGPVKEELPATDEQEERQIESENNSVVPFYENSMLARSLISGAHSLKSDSSTSTTSKAKVPSESLGTNAEAAVKSECLLPDLEPEVVISEQGDCLTQNRSSASTSQSNHAAICGDCPHCGTKYSNQSALKYHVRLMHSDLTNRLCCYLCPRSFTMRDIFKEHMWIFHGQRN